MTDLSPTEIAEQIEAAVSMEDVKHDSTLQSITSLSKLLCHVNPDCVDSILFLGAGEGGLTDAIGNCFDADVCHAVDIDSDALVVAADRGLQTHEVDVEREQLPLVDDSIDLVGSFGLLEHLTWYDNALSETNRVLRNGGYAIFAMPNMAGWTNRLSLLTGHQPRNVEFSKQQPFGIMDAYDTNHTVGHVHAPTIGAFQEFFECQDFKTVDTVGLHPYQKGWLVALADRLVSRRPSLCRRFAVLGRHRPDR